MIAEYDGPDGTSLTSTSAPSDSISIKISNDCTFLVKDWLYYVECKKKGGTVNKKGDEDSIEDGNMAVAYNGRFAATYLHRSHPELYFDPFTHFTLKFRNNKCRWQYLLGFADRMFSEHYSIFIFCFLEFWTKKFTD